MKKYKGYVLAAMTVAGMVFGILPGCVEETILRAVTPFLLS